MEYNDGDIADDGAGNFVVYKYGRWHPADETGRPLGPIDASSRWGSGARELPNGSVERVGPRGGVTVVANTPQGEEGVGRLTEGQGKAMLYGGMMAGAERDYQRARENGYDPASARNQLAGIAGVIPFDGDYFGRLIRDDVSDAGRQAELRWAEGNLRQLTGAAATNPEIARVAAINFDRGNDQLAGQRYQTREETYRGTRFAAGPGAAQLGAYPEYGLGGAGPVDATGLPTYPSIEGGREALLIPAGADIRRGPDGKSYAVVNSENLAPEDTPESLRAAGYQQDADGTWFRMVGSDLPPGDGGGVDGSARPGSGGDARPAPAGGGSAVGMEQVLGGQAAFARSALEQVPFGDELMAGFAGVMSGQGYDRMREAQGALADYDRQNNRFERNMGGVAGATAQIPVGMGVAGMAPRALQMAPRVAGATRLANTGRLAANAGRAGAAGGATGAFYGAGAGEGGLAERADDAVRGGVLGAVATPIVGAAARPVINNVLAPAGRVIARPIAALGERFGVPGAADMSRRLAPNVLEGAVDRYGARFNPDAGVLTQRADERAAQGLETTFVDLMDEGQRGLGRALATRQTPARQAVREFAEGRAERLPDRMAMQARRTMSDDPRSPAEIRDQLAASGRREAEPLYREAYSRQIEPSPVIDEMLSRPAGRAALQKAYTIARNEGRNPNELGMFVSTREAGSPAASSRLPPDPELFADLDAMRAGRRTQGPARGESLLEFISKNGGVRDDGGDLAAIGADAWNRQGAWRSRAVRDDGLSLEQMADRARAAGYFDDVADATADSADNYQRISSQDMARAIDAELRGNPRFARAVGDTDRSANAALRSSRRNALEERLSREGIDISRASNADIARALRDADDAEARAMAFMDGDSPGPQVELIPGETPSMQTLDYVKRGFDDVLEGSRNATGQLVLDTNGRAVQQLRRDYRAELDRLNPAYAAARASHASASQLQRATELGENFLSMEADEFSRQASRLNPAEREVAVAAARRAVERGAGTQGAAPGVAQRLASGREQNMRNAALLENPIPMQDAMRAEREGVMAARAVYPGSGSITSQAVSDQAQAGMNVLSAGANAVTGNVRGTVGALGRLVRLGYSDQEANALMTAAIDPNRTREVIDMLATRMNRQDARSTLRAIRFSASRGAGEYAGDEE